MVPAQGWAELAATLWWNALLGSFLLCLSYCLGRLGKRGAAASSSSSTGPDVLTECGLDAALLIRFLSLCFRLSFFAAFWGCGLLLPVYLLRGGGGGEGYVAWTMANLPRGGEELWACVVAQYLFTLHALFLLRHECKVLSLMRQSYLAEGAVGVLAQARYTCLVERVPSELRSSAAMEAFFSELGFAVHSAVLAPDVSALERLLQRRRGVLGRLRAARSSRRRAALAEELRSLGVQVECERAAALRASQALDSMDRELLGRLRAAGLQAVQGLRDVRRRVSGVSGGSPLSALTFGLEAALAASERAAELSLALTLGNRMGDTAFVTFESLASATCVCQVLLTQRADTMTARPAPEPRDILWVNVSVPAKQVKLRRILTGALFSLGAIFWAIPVTAVSAAASLPLGSCWFYSLLSGYLPVLALLGLINLLPMLFAFVAVSYEGSKSVGEVEQSVLRRFFNYQLANVWISVTAGSVLEALEDIVENPSALATILGSTFPSISVYFINLIIVKACVGLSLELSQILPVRSPPPPRLNYGSLYPSLLLVFLVATMYSVIAPLVSVASSVFFGLAALVYRRQLLLLYSNSFESGGAFWQSLYARVSLALVLGNVTLLGFMALRGGYRQSPALVPCVLLPIAQWFYNNEKYGLPSQRLSLELAREMDRKNGEGGVIGIAPSFDREAYFPPCLLLQGEEEEENEEEEEEEKEGGEGLLHPLLA
jgi:hypothetical protein